MSRGLGAVAALAGSLALVGAGCGTKTLNTDNVETEIKRGLTEQTGTNVKSVDCPDDVEAKKGENFECEATSDAGQKQRVKVTQLDDDGNVRWSAQGS